MAIQFVPQLFHEGRKRISEVLIFAAAEPIAHHVYTAAKEVGALVQRAYVLALALTEQRSKAAVTTGPQAVESLIPIQRFCHPVSSIANCGTDFYPILAAKAICGGTLQRPRFQG